jgi:hypothetical protein
MSEPELFAEALGEDRVRKLAEAGVPPPFGPRWAEVMNPTGPELLVWENGSYALRRVSGESATVRVSSVGNPVDVAGPWDVSFPPKRGAPASVILPELISLHRHADAGVRYFSGTATYAKALTIPAEALRPGKRLYLDLGRVEVIAKVHVNGRSIGVAWKPPYRLDISEAAQPGSNRLEIEVTNLWPNRLIGDEYLPEENEYSTKGTNIKDIGQIKEMPGWFLRNEPKPGARVTFSTWRHYRKDSPLVESGLLGPVWLRGAVSLPLGGSTPERRG